MNPRWPTDFRVGCHVINSDQNLKFCYYFRIYLEQLYHCLLVGSFDNENESLIATRAICNGSNRFWNGELVIVLTVVKIKVFKAKLIGVKSKIKNLLVLFSGKNSSSGTSSTAYPYRCRIAAGSINLSGSVSLASPRRRNPTQLVILEAVLHANE